MEMFKKIGWGPELDLGNPIFDDEHKSLFIIYNKLVDVIQQGKTRHEMAEILTELAHHSLDHFRSEELYMEKLGYPKRVEHKKLHKEFTFQVSMFNSNLLSDHPPKAEEIALFLYNWLFDHIQQHDTEYEIYKRSQPIQ